MAWGTAASFEESYMRRIRPPESSKAWNAFLRAGAPLSPVLRAHKKKATLRGPPEMRTQPMVPQVSAPVLRQRTERRIAVRLPRRGEADFATQGQVVHVHDSQWDGEKLIGVRFTGPRFQRMFRSESAA